MAINQLTLPPDTPAGTNLIITIPIGKTDVFKQVDRIDIEVVSADGSGFSDLISIEKAAGKPNELMEVNKPVTLNLAKGRFDSSRQRVRLELSSLPPGAYALQGTLTVMGIPVAITPMSFRVSDTTTPVPPAPPAVVPPANTGSGNLSDGPGSVQRVTLTETNREPTDDQHLWIYIRNGTVDFNKYRKFIDGVMTADDRSLKSRFAGSPLFRTDAYAFLKQATDFYMTQYFSGVPDINDTIDNTYQESRATPEEQLNEHRRTRRRGDLSVQPGTDILPYFEQVLNRMTDVLPQQNSPAAAQLLPSLDPFKVPNLTLLELIWSYWHEEGGLVQTLNAISLRFQNVRGGNGHDPLAALNIDPLRPLSSLIWGYIQDERFRLSLAQRNFEYQYEYGLSMIGRAVPNVEVAESRSQFIPAFHNLLKAATDFYQQANYTTVIPDGFPILNHLREVHLLLAEGAHNSFRDLPYTARAEMLTQQWILARPEMREFLGGRIMVPYTEPWMDRVDTMKTIQGWDPANITHFHDLGRSGEQLLLSIRYGNWNSTGTGAINAANWAHYWREEIQRYVHAYKAVTSVDLTADITDARFSMPRNNERYEQPAILINRRVGMLPPGQERMGGMNQLNRQRVLREG